MSFPVLLLFLCTASASPAVFNNPVLWQDIADNDIFRVGDRYFFSGSSMHFSPGAPILQSYDLVNWEFIGHSIPSLDFNSPAYDLLDGQRAYTRGVWASYLRYRESTNLFYWGGCVDFNQTYFYTAPSITGPWTRRNQIDLCLYDAGLLIDDDDTMYVAHGSTNLSVSQLSPDGFDVVKTQQVYASDIGYIEGSRFYKYNGNYYIFTDYPVSGQYILKSTTGPWGPYTRDTVLYNVGTPISGGDNPHQGSLIETQEGDWYYMAFVDSYPGGRVPVLAPIVWNATDWPVLQTVGSYSWGTEYPWPKIPAYHGPAVNANNGTFTDEFKGSALGPEWEWNHNPDNSKWHVDDGVHLQTATVTDDLYQARNTLTHRVVGPASAATIRIDYSGMIDGDRAGLVLLRDSSAWIGIERDLGQTTLAVVQNITMNMTGWSTTNTGQIVASKPLDKNSSNIWLRAAGDFLPSGTRQGNFSYSFDGHNFELIDDTFIMDNIWEFFMGYRFGIFNYATQSLGGKVVLEEFTMERI